MKKYYILINDKVKGPFNVEQLNKHKIDKNTGVFYQGMPEWSTIEYVTELNDQLSMSHKVYKNLPYGTRGKVTEMILLVVTTSIAFYLAA